jgi:hypothetical protein
MSLTTGIPKSLLDKLSTPQLTDLFNDPVEFLEDEENEDFLRELQEAIQYSGKNPSLETLLINGILIFGASLILAELFSFVEVSILPTIVVSPIFFVSIELLIRAVEIAVIDINLAYWTYVYRVIQEPNVKQEIKFLPPWGL